MQHVDLDAPMLAAPKPLSAVTSSMTPKDPMLLGKRVSWAELVQEALQKPVKSVTHKSIARLWSGYGSIQEVAATTDDGQQHRLVVKQVDPPQERGVSHERKLKSYAAEAAFYSHYCSRVLASGSAAAVAQPLLVDVRPPTHFLFVLSDLRVQFPERRYTLDAQDSKAALDWLAAFHALWWEEVPGQEQPVSHSAPFSIPAGSTQSGSSGPQPPTGVWDQGCYWHLETRQQEFSSMSRSWSDLRAVAITVDAVLKGQRADGTPTARHQTLVHGDFKAENLLWNADGRCCAYDFQYVGKGLCGRDIAYLFCAGVDVDVLDADRGEQSLLQHYHSALLQQLRANGKSEAAQQYSFDVLLAQFELCLVDYVRFMAGWGMWGNSEWASERVREVLQRLDKTIQTARTGW